MAGYKRARSNGRGRKGSRKRSKFGRRRVVSFKRSVKRSIRKIYRRIRKELRIDHCSALSANFDNYGLGANAVVGIASAIDVPPQGDENFQITGRSFRWKEWIFTGSFSEEIDRNDVLYVRDGIDFSARFFVIVDKKNSMSAVTTFARNINLFASTSAVSTDQDSIWMLPPSLGSAVVNPVRNPSTYDRYEIIYSKKFSLATQPDLYSPTVTTENAKRILDRPFMMRVKCPKKFQKSVALWGGGGDDSKNQVIFCVWLFPDQSITHWVEPPAGGNCIRLNFEAYSKYYDDD